MAFKNLTATFQVTRLTHLFQKSVKKRKLHIYIYIVTSGGHLTKILNMLAINKQHYMQLFISLFSVNKVPFMSPG